MKPFLLTLLSITLITSCSTSQNIPKNYRELSSAVQEKNCTSLMSSFISQLPSKESVRAFIARTYKKYKIDPNIVNLQGTVYKMKGEDGVNIEFELGKKLGHGYNGSVYILKNQHGVLASVDSTQPFVIKMSNHYKKEMDITLPGQHDKSLEMEYVVEDFFKSKLDSLWKSPEMDRFKDSWQDPKLPIAIAYKKLKSKNGVFLVKPLVRGMFLGDIVKVYGKKSSDIPPEMKASLKEIYDFAQIIHQKVIVPGKVTGKTNDQGFSLDLKPENLVWVHETEAMEFFGLKKPSFVFVEFSHYAGGDWAYHQDRVTFQNYFQVFLNYLSSAN